MKLNKNGINSAALDFRYLLNRGYPRKNILDLIGNRYQLYAYQRKLLHRGVFSTKEIRIRRSKLLNLRQLKGCILGIDGHNVLITLESALLRKPLILAQDGLLRDISGVSAKYRITRLTIRSLNIIFKTLEYLKVRRADFYFDAPLSKSGELAQITRNLLNINSIKGNALAIKVPEKMLLKYKFVATSDSALIDKIKGAFDLSGYIIKKKLKIKNLNFFRFLP